MSGPPPDKSAQTILITSDRIVAAPSDHEGTQRWFNRQVQRRPRMSTPAEIVRRGYDAAAERYAAGRDHHDLAHLRRLAELLPAPATVLDIGCGSGRPVDAFLVEQGYEVIGINLSPRQV